MPRTRPPSLLVLAFAGVVLFIAMLLLLLADLPGAGHGTVHSTPAHCHTSPMRTCTSHSTPGAPGRGATSGARQTAGATTKRTRAAAPKAPTPPKAPGVSKRIR